MVLILINALFSYDVTDNLTPESLQKLPKLLINKRAACLLGELISLFLSKYQKQLSIIILSTLNL